jgi:hypothetical protein
MYAHISEQLINGTVEVVATTVIMEQIRTVLTEVDAILNSLTALCRYSIWVAFNESHTGDYQKVIRMLNEGLCREADERDKEYATYGGGKSPRPRNCPDKHEQSSIRNEEAADGTSEVA